MRQLEAPRGAVNQEQESLLSRRKKGREKRAYQHLPRRQPDAARAAAQRRQCSHSTSRSEQVKNTLQDPAPPPPAQPCQCLGSLTLAGCSRTAHTAVFRASCPVTCTDEPALVYSREREVSKHKVSKNITPALKEMVVWARREDTRLGHYDVSQRRLCPNHSDSSRLPNAQNIVEEKGPVTPC